MKPARIVAWASSAVSVGLYAVSLGLPALVFRSYPAENGLTVLLWGWWGLLTGDFPWFANPAYFAALVLTVLTRFRAAQILALLAVGLGMLSVDVREWYFNEGGGTLILRLGTAFYFWMASFCVLAVGVTAAGIIHRRRRDA